MEQKRELKYDPGVLISNIRRISDELFTIQINQERCIRKLDKILDQIMDDLGIENLDERPQPKD